MKQIVPNKTYFLYEGKTEGEGTLVFRVRSGDLVLAETSLTMALCEVSQLVDTYQIDHTPATLAPDGDEYKLEVGDYRTTPASVEMPWNSSTNDVVLLVLGWNVDVPEEKSWRDTLFKRLFWHGYKGRTAAFIWPKLWGFTMSDAFSDGPHFDRSEHRAWLSASKAAGLISNLLQKYRHVTVISHSQGNVVVGEALKELAGQPGTDCNRITYIACQAAISAHYYATTFKSDENDTAHQLDVFSPSMRLTKLAGDVWRFTTQNKAPDIQGHFPNGLDEDKPYLTGCLTNLKRTVNYYNRMDYALNIWIANNASKPDNLAYDFTYDKKTGCYYREFKDASGEIQKKAIDPAKDESARWCVFSFVAYTRSLAVGQMEMEDVFNRSCDLKKDYSFQKTHYYHSLEFRSNILELFQPHHHFCKSYHHAFASTEHRVLL